MNAYRVPDSHLIDPPDMREPTDAEIAEYAAYLKPKLLASRADAGDLLADQSGVLGWNAFAELMHDGYVHTARLHFLDLIERSAGESAERIADEILRGGYDHDDTLRRIGADDAATFFKRLDEERRV